MNSYAEENKALEPGRDQSLGVTRPDSFKQGEDRGTISTRRGEQERGCRNDDQGGTTYFRSFRPGKILDQLISQSEERLADIEQLIELLLREKDKTNQQLQQVRQLKDLVNSEPKVSEEE